MVGNFVAQTLDEPTNYFFDFSSPVAYFALQLLDFTGTDVVTLSASGEDVTQGTVTRTDSQNCGGRFGCVRGEFFALYADVTDLGNTFTEAEITHLTNETLMIDNLRVCVLEETAPVNPPAVYNETVEEATFERIPINAKNTEPQVFTIVNEGNATINSKPLTIENITITGPDASDFYFKRVARAFPFDLQPGQSLDIEVYFDPETAGDKFAFLTIDYEDHNGAATKEGERMRKDGDIPLGPVCGTIAFDSMTLGQVIATNEPVQIDLQGTIVNITFSAGSAGANSLTVESVADTTCAGDFCGEIMGAHVARPSTGPTNYYMEISPPIAYLSLNLGDMNRSGVISMGDDVTYGPQSELVQRSCARLPVRLRERRDFPARGRRADHRAHR